MDCSCAASNWFYPGSGSVNYNDDDDDHIHSFGFYSSDGKMEYEHTIFDWCAVRRVRILCYEPNICEESLNGKEKKTHNTITIDEEMCTLLTGVKKVCVFYWYCMLFCWFFFHHHHHLYRMCAFLCIIFSNAYIHWKKKKTIYVSESCYTYYIFFSLTFSSSFLCSSPPGPIRMSNFYRCDSSQFFHHFHLFSTPSFSVFFPSSSFFLLAPIHMFSFPCCSHTIRFIVILFMFRFINCSLVFVNFLKWCVFL